MKLKALLLGLAFLASLVPSASAQISNIVNSRPGIAYNANSRTVVNNYVIKPEDHTVLVDCTTAAVTITLPPVSAKAYPYVVIKKIDSSGNAVTVRTTGSSVTIDGASTLTLSAQYQTAILQANATTWSNLGNPGSTTNSGTYTQTSSSSAAFASGPNGNTNPVFRLVNNVSSAATGISVTGRAAAAGTDITVLSSGTNESLVVNAKGSGTILLNGTATGGVYVGDLTTPAFSVVHTTEGTGWGITSAAAASGVAFTVTSSGTNESGTIDAKGSGTLLLNGTATGAVLVGDVTNPAFGVTHTTEGTGWGITSAAAASGVAFTVTSSGTDESGTINAKGAGDITLQGTATGSTIANRLLYTEKTEVVAATNVITAAESGKTFFLNDATEFVSTLPAPAAGLRYTFIVTGAPSGASYTVVTDSSANVIIGMQVSIAGDAGDTGTADDTVTFVDGQAVAGDRLEVWCDGTNWFGTLFTKIAAGGTFTQASP